MLHRGLLLVVAIAAAFRPWIAGATAVGDEDRYLWLEDISGERALNWVREQNRRTEKKFAATPSFVELERTLKARLDSQADIPAVNKIGEYYYSLQRDTAHPRGLWSRTTLEEYRKPQPKWEVLLDVDALNAAEAESWLLGATDCLRPHYNRCLISFSRGGADARVTREYDLTTRTWIKDGFVLPEAKGWLEWIDQDNVYVATDFGPGSMTAAGYPRIIKRWRRGTPLSSAETVFAAQPSDLMVKIRRERILGVERELITRMVSPYQVELYERDDSNRFSKIDVPDSADKVLKRDWLMVLLREPWTLSGQTFPVGTLLAIGFADFKAGSRKFERVFEPADTAALVGMSWTRNYLVINVLQDVSNHLYVLTPQQGGWRRKALAGAEQFSTVTVWAQDEAANDVLWMRESGYLNPGSLSLMPIGGRPEVVKTAPADFDTSGSTVEQFFAVSADGTRVPYFMVRPKAMKYDGTTPTLLYGYGGFETSLRPSYSALVGQGWIARGGIYVVANIRGGGEYGPRWHQAAQKENRYKSYQDFVAVARDLIGRGITSPKRLAAQGASNGGLLAGNMLTQYPELFGAIVIQVPLLDMRRYHQLLAGASWMAEYGDPDQPQHWAYLKKISPYHLFDPKRNYPPVLITTSARDDRVHPGHARKMAAKMMDAGKDVTYYEEVEGGHSVTVDSAQAAHAAALVYSFLWKQLDPEGTPAPRRTDP